MTAQQGPSNHEPPEPDSGADRRSNVALRELLDELIDHVREISQLRDLHPQKLEHAQERLEWLADEVWRLAVERDEPR